MPQTGKRLEKNSAFMGVALWLSLLCACQSPPAPAAAGQDAVELTDLLRPAPLPPGASAGADSLRRDLFVVRKGRRMKALVLTAPAAARARLPALPAVSRLECLTAPVFNVGDGFELEVALVTGNEREVVYRRYYDPGREAADRSWIPLSIALPYAAGDGAELEIRVSGGPQGDLVADWLAIAAPRVVWK
jgi:hypothetical protein